MAYDPIAIVRRFLFGTTNPSSDYNEHIRPIGQRSDSVSYNMADYMETGGGRFAYPSLAPALKAFFDSPSLPDGTYTWDQMKALLNLGDRALSFEIKQYGVGIGSADHAERAFIFGSTWFDVQNTLTFTVANGQRSIQNMEVRPQSDNWDLRTDSRLVQLVNSTVLRSYLDPYYLGGPVAINFHGNQGTSYLNFTQADFEGYEQIEMDGRLSTPLGLASIIANGGLGYFDNIISDPYIRYRTDGLEVIYGTPGNDSLDIGDYRSGIPPLNAALMLVAGTGNDTVVGGFAADKLLGGEGNDSLVGFTGRDTLEGGLGNDTLDGGFGSDVLRGGADFDTYSFVGGFGSDLISDSDGQGRVIVQGTLMTGGSRRSGETVYTDASSQSSYLWLGSTLQITREGSPTITVENWSNGQLGIVLRQDPPNPPPPPNPRPPRDPLVIDLDGDGLELRAADGFVLFDHNADGIRTGTGWALADDGLLAWDRNGNGNIDTGRELFGEDTYKSNGQLATNGFDALSDLDSNLDGVFNALDNRYGDLRVWRDLDQDGVADAGELQTLAASGIAGISLASTAHGGQINNNVIESTSTVSLSSGGTSIAGAINFAQNLTARLFTPQTPEGHVPVIPAAAALPGILGTGMVRDIREAASLSTPQGEELLSLYQTFCQATTFAEQIALVEPLITAWAATSTLAPSTSTSTLLAVNANGPGSDTAVQAWARLNPSQYAHVSVLERFSGGNFIEQFVVAVSSGHQVTWTEQQTAQLEANWQTFRSTVYATLVSETRLKPYLEAIGSATAERVPGFDTSGLTALIAARASTDASNTILDILDLHRVASPMLRAVGFNVFDSLAPLLAALPTDSPLWGTLQTHFGLMSSTAAATTAGNDLFLGSAGNNSLHVQVGSDLIYMGAGNDSVMVSNGLHFVDGGSGNDTLTGGFERSVLRGGDGNDLLTNVPNRGNAILYGDAGDDVLRLYQRSAAYGGDGNDTLTGLSGYSGSDNFGDTLDGGGGNDVIDGGIGGDDMFGGDGNDLFIVDNLEDVVEELIGNGIDSVQSSVTWTLGANVENLTLVGLAASEGIGNALDNTIVGNSATNLLDGGHGADVLFSRGGADTLVGGRGNDHLTLDTRDGALVAFSRGDGADIVASSYALGMTRGYAHTLRFNGDIWLDELTLENLGGGNYRLLIGTSGDSISFVADQTDVKGASRPFDYVQFMGAGREVTWATFVDTVLSSQISTLTPYGLLGSGQADTIVGDEGDDSAIAGAGIDARGASTGGDDLVYGNGGNDHLYEGHGDDILLGGKGDDYLSGGNGTNVMLGEAGNDTLSGDLGHNARDFFDGGEGEDRMVGSSNSDTYYFRRGSGRDRINDFDQSSAGHDVLIFSSGISPADVVVTRDGLDLLLSVGGTSESVRIEGVFSQVNYLIEHVLFDDGTLWTSAELLSRVVSPATAGDDTVYALPDGMQTVGLDGNDYFIGSNAADSLSGGAGHDAFEAGNGNDTLHGGTGNDTLNGRDGSDVYIFGRGDGLDTIYDAYGTLDGTEPPDIDEIRLGVNPQEVELSQGGYNGASLFVRIPDSGDRIEVWGWFDAQNNDGLQLRFSDGTVWNAETIRQRMIPSGSTQYIYGASGGDYLQGDSGDNLLSAGAGNDTLWGGEGNDDLRGGVGDDVYRFGYGAGVDSVYEFVQGGAGHGVDTVLLDSGIAQSDVVIDRSDPFRTVITLVNSNDQLHIHHNNNTDQRVEWLQFADGLRLSLGTNPLGANILGTGNDTFTGSVHDDTIMGNGGSDSLFGSYGHDFLSGGEGNDTLVGEEGADTLDGGAGNDVLAGSAGDFYVFGRGYGHDVINRGYDRHATILLGPGITSSDLRLTGLPNAALRIQILGTSDVLDLNYWHIDWSTASNDAIVFADGTRWNGADIASHVDNAGTSATDYLYGDNVADILAGAGGDDSIAGYAGDDVLSGGEGNDTIQGHSGIDTLEGGTGNDVLEGGEGLDVYLFNRGDGRDTIFDNGLSKTESAGRIVFGAGIEASDIIVDGELNSQSANYGSLTLTIRGTTDSITLPRWLFQETTTKVELVSFANGTTWSKGDLLARFHEAHPGGAMFGSEAADVIAGGAEDDQIDGLGGNDTLQGHAGDDILFGDDGDDRLDGGEGRDTLHGGIGDDTYLLAEGIGQDIVLDVDRVNGADRVLVAAGLSPDDVEVSRTETDLVLAIRGTGDRLNIRWFLHESLRIESVVFANGVIWTATQVEEMAREWAVIHGTSSSDTIPGTTGDDELIGNGGDDLLAGWLGRDTLDGGEGSDTLDGGSGMDVLRGGLGDDIFIVDDVQDAVVEGVGGGNDTVRSNVTWTLGDHLENLHLTGELAIDAHGNVSANHMRGNASSNTLDGNGGADTLEGGAGDDVYVVGELGDTVIEAADQGQDTVRSSVSFTLDVNVEHLVLTGGADINGTGNALSNDLQGNSGANVLFAGDSEDTIYGHGGDDTLVGGGGADFLHGGEGSNVYRYARDDGNDTVYGNSSDWLEFDASILPTDVAITREGHALIIAIAGSLDHITLPYFISGGNALGISFADGTTWSATTLFEMATSIYGTGGDDLMDGTEELDRLLGLEGNDTLYGNWGNDQLDGGLGADSMAGGGGDDIYWVDQTGDVVAENWYEGYDTVRSTISYTLSATLERLELLGTGNVNATGNSSANTLIGNVGNNVLNGGSGDDTMFGGQGNDTYVVGTVDDVVVELANEGTDTIQSSIGIVLSDNVENLTLTGSAALVGEGNALNNLLTGNSGANILSGHDGNDTLVGGSGPDTLIGGSGNDTYVVDSTTDVVTELVNEGTDLVQSSVTFTLAANVENLTLTGSNAINGTGNGMANALTGNSGANRLDGSTGADTMIGGAGNDTYVVDVAGDVVTELAAGGTDTIESSLTWTLGVDVENLTLTGTSAINGTGNAVTNTLAGNSGANVLDGGAGADNMVGGAGNDTYIVDNNGDIVTEAASAGIDLVQSSVTYTLATNVENLTLTGAGAINGTGNTLNNVLTGNGANNTLNGGTGTDTLIGGAGDDIYVVDATTDVVTEAAGEGTDLVQSAVTYTLAANVENLTLTGTNVINGTGNTLNNVLIGNSANNNLSGGAGNDTIDGGTGNDTMVGGAGDDTYVVNVSTDIVTEAANEGTDTVQSAVTLTLVSNVENLTLTGTGTINGTGNTLNNVLIGNSANNNLDGGSGNDTLDGGLGSDTLVGGAGNDTFVVNVSTDVITESASEGTDTVQSSVTWTLSANLESLTLIGSSAINGTGHTGANVLTGNAQANTLSGLAGTDTLDGGAGNDILDGGTAADTYLFGRGWGTDTVRDNDSTANVKDRIQFGAGIVQGDMRYSRVGNNLEALIFGTTDKVVVQDWYLGNQYHVEEFRFADGSILTDSQVQGLVGAMAMFSAASAGDTSGGRTASRGTPLMDQLSASALI